MDCICSEIRKSTRSITNAYDKFLAPVGIRITQFSILRVLSRNKSLTLGDLAELTVLDQTSATRSVAALEQTGLIERVEHADTRVKNLKLTAKGKRVLERASESWNDAQQCMLTNVSIDEWESAMQTIRKIAASAKTVA